MIPTPHSTGSGNQWPNGSTWVGIALKTDFANGTEVYGRGVWKERPVATVEPVGRCLTSLEMPVTNFKP